jgi:hypothetical protein
LRRWLRAGKYGLVVTALDDLGEARGRPEALAQPVEYLRKHAVAGHLNYACLRRKGLPVGSGAVESAIRRVINLRLKGPGLMWLEGNAEGALVLRAAAVTGRWEEVLAHVREEMGRDRQLVWQGQSPDMVVELKAGKEIKPPEAQEASGSRDRADAD